MEIKFTLTNVFQRLFKPTVKSAVVYTCTLFCILSVITKAQPRIQSSGTQPVHQSSSSAPVMHSDFQSGISAGQVFAEKNKVATNGDDGAKDKLKLKWSANAFDQQEFIENLGQYDKELNSKQKVLFYAELGSTKAYFTPNGVIYRNDALTSNESEEKKEGKEHDDPIEAIPHFLAAKWQNSNPEVTITGSDELTAYYTFGQKGNKPSIKANAFRKITYHDIYPGIDLEYTFPKDKPGIKYAVIVHPGADVSRLKLKYDGNEELDIDENGNVIEHSADTVMKDITDHTPFSYYEGGENVKVEYAVNGRVESFVVKNGYDKTRTLIIDPVTTSPTFSSGYNEGYDLDYDNLGNVYVYGGYNPFKLIQISPSGIVNWTFTTAFTVETEYGDFAVDKVTGESYIAEGILNNTGAEVEKVNRNGSQIGYFGGSPAMWEIWRMVYNPCSRQVVIGGGGINSPNGQIAMLDTNMSTLNPANPYGGGSCCHDVNRLAMDPITSVSYFNMSTVNDGSNNANADNVLVGVTAPSFTTVNFRKSTGESMMEAASMLMVGPGYTGGQSTAGGMNGMAASPNWLYSYDGYTLKKQSKTTGSVVGTVNISAYYSNIEGQNGETDVYWGGLDADACDNTYVGTVAETGSFPASLKIYNSSLALVSSTALPNWPYDVVLGANDATIYVTGGPGYNNGWTGNGYVNAYTNAISTVTASAVATNTTCGLNNGSASASLTLCGTLQPSGSITYSWSTGATTSSISNLPPGSYSVSMNIGCGDVYQASVTVGSSSPPTVTASAAPSTICSGGSTTLSASGEGVGGTYVWSTSQTGSSISVSPTSTQTYTVTGSNGGCSSPPATVVVTVNSGPTVGSITANPSMTICSGQSTTLSTSGATSYTWSTGATTSSITVTPPVGTNTYNVTGTTSGCTGPAAATVTVTVNPTPTVTTSASPSATICQGSSTHLTGGGAGAGGSYVWTASGPGTLTNTNQDTTTATPTVTTTYTVVGTTTAGCSNTTPSTIVVTVNPSPTVSIAAAPSANICSGTSTTLKASGASTYVWSTTQTTSNITVSPTVTTTYTVTGKSAAGCNNSNSTATIVVNVTATPTVTLTGGPNQTICPGNTDTLKATGATTYVWSTGSTNDTTIVTPSGTTTYTVTGKNGACSSGPVKVIVNVGAINVVVISSGGNAVCSGTTDTLKASGASGYTWMPGNTSGATLVISPVTTTTVYTVTGTGGSNGCVGITQYTLTVNTTPTINVGSTNPTGTVCSGDTTQAYVTVTGSGTPPYSYNWSTSPVQTTDTAYGLGAGTYSVTITDAKGCTSGTATVNITVKNLVISTTVSSSSFCLGDSATITASGATSYLWSTGSTSSTITVHPTGDSVFTVMGSTSGTCKDSISDTIKVNALPTNIAASSSAGDTICSGGKGTTLTGTGASTYVWKPGPLTGTSVSVNPSATTTYTVVGTNASGCTDSTTIVIAVNTTPTIVISLSGSGSDTVCSGQPVTLTAKGGSSTTTYLWGNGSTDSTITITPTSDTVLSLVASNGPCADTMANIPVYVYPKLNVTMSSDTACIGKNATVTVNATGGKPGYTYAWSTGAGNTSSISVVPPANVNTYSCTVTDACGASQSAIATVTAYTAPVPAFTASPASILGGQYITFIDSTTGATSYYWTFGNGVTSTQFDPYVQYIEAGTYTVTLIAANAGCKDTVSKTVTVVEEIIIPNVFTPNGDGQNDVFHVTMSSMKVYHIEIFNRWGQKVFMSDSPQTDWDGRSAGGVQESDGTYYYEITATDYAGKNFNYHGYLQLISGK